MVTKVTYNIYNYIYEKHMCFIWMHLQWKCTPFSKAFHRNKKLWEFYLVFWALVYIYHWLTSVSSCSVSRIASSSAFLSILVDFWSNLPAWITYIIIEIQTNILRRFKINTCISALYLQLSTVSYWSEVLYIGQFLFQRICYRYISFTNMVDPTVNK